MTPDKRQDLYSIRRDLISAILNLEIALGIPPEKSAIRTREERRRVNTTIIDVEHKVMVR